MSMTNEQIQALEASALAATTGDWTADDNFGFTVQCYRTGTNRLLATVNGPNAENDMRFIAQASPQNILRVLAERDADKALIAEQAKSIAKLERALDLARNSNSVLAIRSELEASTLNVKLPEPPGPMSLGARAVYIGIVSDVVGAFQESCAAAGITLVVGE